MFTIGYAKNEENCYSIFPMKKRRGGAWGQGCRGCNHGRCCMIATTFLTQCPAWRRFLYSIVLAESADWADKKRKIQVEARVGDIVSRLILCYTARK